MNLNHSTNKQTGDQLSAQEWNSLASDVNELGSNSGTPTASVISTEVDPIETDKTYVKIGNILVGELTDKSPKGTNVTLSGNNNINIEPREAVGTGEGKNNAGAANRKGGNISLKPGDDIELCSHKRGTSKNTEVAIKVIDGSDNPVKLQVFAGDITLTTKGKNKTKKKDNTGADTNELLYDDPNVMNVNVSTGDGKGYLKVRAQAIDLRCEDHGGIAVQPKGYDGQGNMNKIKFEHGGGDGLEFGTFNTEHTSLYTTDYRFNKNGIIKLATRTPIARNTTSDTTDPNYDKKYEANDPTTHYYYTKQADDFYDVINLNDPSCTWEDIVTYIAWAKANNQGPWASQAS